MARLPGNDSQSSRRSDQIRARRSGHTSKASIPTRKSTRQRAAVQMERRDPPVMVRAMSAARPAAASKRPRTRRRYDVALNVPGAEIRLPSVPQVSIGWRLLSFVVVAGLAFLLYQVWNSPKYRVSGAEISGVQRISASEVYAALGIDGEPVFMLNTGELEARLLEAFPEFSSANVSISLPANVSVEVTERVPVLHWKQDGRSLLVDAEGYAVPLRSSLLGLDETPVPADLPVVEASGLPRDSALLFQEARPAALDVITGSAPAAEAEEEDLTAAPLLTPEMVQAVLLLAQRAPAGQPLVYSPDHGLGWKVPEGWDVYLGNAQDVEMKLHVYDAIVSHLQAQQVQPALISVQYVHAPYYRLEN